MSSDSAAINEPGPLGSDAYVRDAIDTEVLDKRCMGNASFAQMLLSEMLADGNRQVDAIVQQLETGDLLAAAEAAHALKGAAGIIGANMLREKAALLEMAGREEQLEIALETLGDLRNEMDRCLTRITQLVTAQVQ